jgi:Kef-type K+ transport system membrane component KefB
MAGSEAFLIAILLIFTLPYLVWRVLQLDVVAPLVVVQIIAGILLGPGVVGAVWPSLYSALFTPEVITALNGIARWAVMLFVFVAGLELDLQAAWTDRKNSGVTAGLALAVPLLFGSVAAAIIIFTFGTAQWVGAHGTTVQFIIGIGMSCAVTALPILVLFLEKLNLLGTPMGQRILRYASLDDVAIWGILALILLDLPRVGLQIGFMIGFLLAAMPVRKVMVRLAENDRWYAGFIWLALAGFCADWCALHFMVGAFLAGAALDAQWFGRDRLDSFRRTILLSVMPVFFLSTGLRTSWAMGGFTVFAAALILLLASVAGKLAGVQIAGHLLQWPRGEARLIGWLLQTKALIMIIFVNVLLDKGIITSDTFTACLLMAVASTMLTIPMVRSVKV